VGKKVGANSIMKKSIDTVIEITESHIKVLQACPIKKVLTLTHCVIKKISGLSDEKISETLSEILTRSKISLEYTISIIPRRFATFVQFHLPTHEDAEIGQMVELQIVNRVPYVKEDMIFDHIILEKEESGYARVLVMVIQKEVVSRYLKILNQAGVYPQELTLSSIGLQHWYIQQKRSLKEGFTEVLINLDVDYSEICFFQKKQLQFSREINFGMKDFSLEQCDNFVHQINLTISAYQKEKMGGDVTSILLVSIHNEMGPLADQIQKEYSFPVKIINPMDNVVYSQDVALARVWESEKTSVGGALGIVLSPLKKFSNFLPKDVTENRKTRQVQKEWVKSGILLGLIILFGGLSFGVESYQKSEYFQKIQKEIKRLKPQVKDIQEKTYRIQVIKDSFKNRIFIAEIIHELYALLPKDIAFNVLDLDMKRELVIEGLAKNGANVNSLQSKMVSSQIFSHVNLQYTKKRKTIQGERVYFKLSCKIVGEL